MRTRSGMRGLWTAIGLACLAPGVASGAPAWSLQEAADAVSIEILMESRNYPQALARLQPRVAAGDAQAQYWLGQMYRDGLGVGQDFERAAGLYALSAHQGNPDGMNAYGRALSDGLGVAPNASEALDWLRQAAERGAPVHQHDYGVALETGLDGSDQGQGSGGAALAAQWYQRSADQGFAPAQTSLGLLYMDGRGVPRDGARALELFRVAAAAGHARAQNNLGLIYVRGEAVERDYVIAREWFERAAEQGLVQAYRNLSVIYQNGFGVEPDEARAFELLAQARAQESFSVSAYLSRIGWPYGTSLAEPDWEALPAPSLFSRAEAGSLPARYELAHRQLRGAGVPQDLFAARDGFVSCAEDGLPGAALTLGILYGRGLGVSQSYVEAYAWFNRAAELGHEESASIRDRLAGEMTPDQVRDASERARTLSERP